MNTLQLPSRDRGKMQSSITETATNHDSVFFDKETSEMILRKLKEKKELEEKREEVNKYCIKLTAFVIIGLSLIYLML